MPKTVTQLLETADVDLSDVTSRIPDYSEAEVALLTGSFADGTATTDSDIDIFMFDIEARPGQREAPVEIVTADRNGREINAVTIPSTIISELLLRFRSGIDALLPTHESAADTMIQRFSENERRMLHRLSKGVALKNESATEALRKNFRLNDLHVYYAFYNLVGYFSYVKKAKMKVADLGVELGFSMLETAANRLLGAIVGSVGETNADREWRPYLIVRNAEKLHRSDVTTGIECAFPRFDLPLEPQVEALEAFAMEAIERIYQRSDALGTLRERFSKKSGSNRLGTIARSKG